MHNFLRQYHKFREFTRNELGDIQEPDIISLFVVHLNLKSAAMPPVFADLWRMMSDPQGPQDPDSDDNDDDPFSAESPI
jgi:hypothetical protein